MRIHTNWFGGGGGRRPLLVRFRMLAAAALGGLALATGCNFAPRYARPVVQTPANYKETNGWKVAEPQDRVIRGKWWEMFNDARLNALEEQLNRSNQNVQIQFANFLAARAIAKQARSQLFPTVTFTPSVTRSLQSSAGNQVTLSTSNSAARGNIPPFSIYSLPFDATWAPDLWGAIRNTVRSDIYAAQASAANLENIRLTAQAELAADYFALQGQDAFQQLLHSTVVADQRALDLTRALYHTGIDSDQNIALAETQLATVLAQETSVGVARAQFEHAIATLIGQPASTFSIPFEPLKATPPEIPWGIPSQLLERRPDIAAAERTVAQANALIGVARAAYFPTLTLSDSAGVQSATTASLLTGPALTWSVGATLAETVFDAGRRRAVTEQARATYGATVASYRQTVLTAFQSVEDNLAAMRIFSLELQQAKAAVSASERNLALSLHRYKVGIDSYLTVITTQTTLLANQETALNVQIQQMNASVQLILALGGGWDASQLPTPAQTISKTPPAP
ncbi:MAG: efflux system, outer rane lipoprotein NodT family [Pedosphaera sp.]|nr:efflux system, outer rane lipoprotein NodT family [Pedosphaera sp.]